MKFSLACCEILQCLVMLKATTTLVEGEWGVKRAAERVIAGERESSAVRAKKKHWQTYRSG